MLEELAQAGLIGVTEMNEQERNKIACRKKLIDVIVRMGYPPEFGAAIAAELGTESTMQRMIGYLHNAKPRTAEEIADEMLAICDDRDRWVQKKKAEYYNSKYNELLYYGLGNDDKTDA